MNFLKILCIHGFCAKINISFSSIFTHLWNSNRTPSVISESIHPELGMFLLPILNTVVNAEHLLSFWESGISIHPRQRLPAWPALSKNPGPWVSFELPTISPGLSQFATGELSTFWLTILGREALEVCALLSQDLTPWAFYLCLASFHCNKYFLKLLFTY